MDNSKLDNTNVVNFPDGLPISDSKFKMMKLNIYSMHCYLQEIDEMFHVLIEGCASLV